MVSGTFSALQGALSWLELMIFFLLDNQFKHLWLADAESVQMCVYIHMYRSDQITPRAVSFKEIFLLSHELLFNIRESSKIKPVTGAQ